MQRTKRILLLLCFLADEGGDEELDDLEEYAVSFGSGRNIDEK